MSSLNFEYTLIFCQIRFQNYYSTNLCVLNPDLNVVLIYFKMHHPSQFLSTFELPIKSSKSLRLTRLTIFFHLGRLIFTAALHRSRSSRKRLHPSPHKAPMRIQTISEESPAVIINYREISNKAAARRIRGAAVAQGGSVGGAGARKGSGLPGPFSAPCLPHPHD